MKISTVLLTALAFIVPPPSVAQEYPVRPIKLVVPWPTGQATDSAARIMAERLAPALGQPIVIDNRAGAGGTIGTEFAAKAAPDGYTLLAGSSGPISISPHVQKLGYDPQKHFAPIYLLASTPYVLVTHPGFPAANLGEFIAMLRSSAGKHSFASSGLASTSHLVAEMFNSAARVSATHVPYKGSSAAVTDVIGGHVAFTFETTAAVLGHVRAGRLKALAVSSARRAAALPEIPTMAEGAALRGFDVRAWVGLLAPAGISKEVLARLAVESKKVFEDPEVRNRFIGLGFEPAGLTPDEFALFMKEQDDRFSSIAKQANVRLD
jgi:tripartite-type tricarboxylate transporter receptor subunit TctC